ncbi:MAG: BON domain-containing protein [Burkholderiaceae bacterium]
MKTDAQLQQDVMAELRWEPSIHAERIGVEVSDGVVRLSGLVDNFAEKWNAEHAARRVRGVNVMVTELRVHLPAPSQRSDGDIARAVQHLLDWNALLPADAIKVMVEAGWVTLSGDVKWSYQKQAATEGIKSLIGVVGVNDEIFIEPAENVPASRQDIEAALRRSAVMDADSIGVSIDGAEVTLSGSVRSCSERETASHVAWASPGVRKVLNKIMVVY